MASLILLPHVIHSSAPTCMADETSDVRPHCVRGLLLSTLDVDALSTLLRPRNAAGDRSRVEVTSTILRRYKPGRRGVTTSSLRNAAVLISSFLLHIISCPCRPGTCHRSRRTHLVPSRTGNHPFARLVRAVVLTRCALHRPVKTLAPRQCFPVTFHPQALPFLTLLPALSRAQGQAATAAAAGGGGGEGGDYPGQRMSSLTPTQAWHVPPEPPRSGFTKPYLYITAKSLTYTADSLAYREHDDEQSGRARGARSSTYWKLFRRDPGGLVEVCAGGYWFKKAGEIAILKKKGELERMDREHQLWVAAHPQAAAAAAAAPIHNIVFYRKASADTKFGVTLASSTEWTGAMLRRVAVDSLAAEAGLCEGDVILKINGTEVHDDKQASRLLISAPAGAVELVVQTRANHSSEISRVLAQSAADANNSQLARAIAQSTAGADDPELAHALAQSATADEDHELAHALAQSAAVAADDPELAQALAQSAAAASDESQLAQALAQSASTAGEEEIPPEVLEESQLAWAMAQSVAAAAGPSEITGGHGGAQEIASGPSEWGSAPQSSAAAAEPGPSTCPSTSIGPEASGSASTDGFVSPVAAVWQPPSSLRDEPPPAEASPDEPSPDEPSLASMGSSRGGAAASVAASVSSEAPSAEEVVSSRLPRTATPPLSLPSTSAGVANTVTRCAQPATVPEPAVMRPAMTLAERLREIDEARDQRLLSEAEYAQARARLIERHINS